MTTALMDMDVVLLVVTVTPPQRRSQDYAVDDYIYSHTMNFSCIQCILLVQYSSTPIFAAGRSMAIHLASVPFLDTNKEGKLSLRKHDAYLFSGSSSGGSGSGSASSLLNCVGCSLRNGNASSLVQHGRQTVDSRQRSDGGSGESRG
jgi:hypothetical protein